EAWKNKTLHQLYEIAQTPWAWHEELERVASEYDVPLIGTPYDLTAVDFLESKNCLFYKIASFEATDIQFLKKVASTKKPIIISRGMTTFKEISQAISILKEAGASEIILLHCVSAYPAKPSDLNLLAIKTLEKEFPQLVIGLSEHTITTASSVAAVVIGAKVVERHLILQREDGGPDAAFSLEPKEFSRMVQEIRQVEQALGDGILEPVPAEIENKQFRRSLWAIKEIKKGEELTKENVGSFRPSAGLEVKHLENVLGKKAKEDIAFATPLSWDLIN
ncbi:N-acetylneuraminate synthase family protein, partial [Candidatus Parcubacteria bacterium]|nr:N-acetylneuraminate synthase family protein [Candidatus Parcubacteria bacterium]